MKRNGATARNALSGHVLVLNKLYMAIHMINVKRAFALLCKESAEVVEHEGDTFSSYNLITWIAHSRQLWNQLQNGKLEFVRTPREAIQVPRIIRLLGYGRLPRRVVKFNRRNVLARDGNRCQYCGKRLPTSALSVDHVVPRSRGGRSVWSNVVAACNACNARKGGRTPDEVGMKLLRRPVAPRRNPIVRERLRDPRYTSWKTFLDSSQL